MAPGWRKRLALLASRLAVARNTSRRSRISERTRLSPHVASGAGRRRRIGNDRLDGSTRFGFAGLVSLVCFQLNLNLNALPGPAEIQAARAAPARKIKPLTS